MSSLYWFWNKIISSIPSFSQSLKILIDLDIKNIIENKVAIIDAAISIVSAKYTTENNWLFFSSESTLNIINGIKEANNTKINDTIGKIKVVFFSHKFKRKIRIKLD